MSTYINIYIYINIYTETYRKRVFELLNQLDEKDRELTMQKMEITQLKAKLSRNNGRSAVEKEVEVLERDEERIYEVEVGDNVNKEVREDVEKGEREEEREEEREKEEEKKQDEVLSATGVEV